MRITSSVLHLRKATICFSDLHPAIVDRTPKCYCVLAGEGIKYSWGCAKNIYCRTPLKKKQGKDNFRSVVQECLSREKVLTTQRVRLFSRRAHAYICAYYKMWWIDKHKMRTQQTQLGTTATFTPVKIEKMVKQFKTHRCALDFDHSFCKAVYIDLTDDDNGN